MEVPLIMSHSEYCNCCFSFINCAPPLESFNLFYFCVPAYKWYCGELI